MINRHNNARDRSSVGKNCHNRSSELAVCSQSLQMAWIGMAGCPLDIKNLAKRMTQELQGKGSRLSYNYLA